MREKHTVGDRLIWKMCVSEKEAELSADIFIELEQTLVVELHETYRSNMLGYGCYSEHGRIGDR
jgi:hypothetical protein